MSRPKRFAQPTRASNDNALNVLPMPMPAWDVYWCASRGRRVGQVVAMSADAAVKAVGVEFHVDVRKLIAVRCRNII
jgi:hypothetical protein